MSKSLRNYIGVTEPPAEIYGKTLSLPDDAMALWYELLLGSELPRELGPRDAKRTLARALVVAFHGPGADAEAEAAFDRVHLRREIPDEVPSVTIGPDVDGVVGESGLVHLPALLRVAFGISSSEGRRLLAQGGVKLDGEPVAAEPLDVPLESVTGRVLQAGKRRFARIVAGS
jgi:tyrosyl-tRNA synthetase